VVMKTILKSWKPTNNDEGDGSIGGIFWTQKRSLEVGAP
jgi:hypothetical protein